MRRHVEAPEARSRREVNFLPKIAKVARRSWAIKQMARAWTTNGWGADGGFPSELVRVPTLGLYPKRGHGREEG